MENKERKRPTVSTRDSKLVGKAISGKLKAFYDEIVAQEVPDRFKELLEKLDKTSNS